MFCYACHTHSCALRLTNQVDSDASSYEVSHVDVYWVTAVLSYLRQPGEARRHAESKHQQWLQQLGRAVDAGIEIHLWREEAHINVQKTDSQAYGDRGGDVIKKHNNSLQQQFYLNSRMSYSL